MPELLVMQTQLNGKAGWEMYKAGVQACPKDVGAPDKEVNSPPFLGDVKKPRETSIFLFQWILEILIEWNMTGKISTQVNTSSRC